MRFEHLLTAVRGLRYTDAQAREQITRRVKGANWLLWHGRDERCLKRLEALRRDTGWSGFRNPLGNLIGHLHGRVSRLINCFKRYHADRAISTSGVESAMDYVIGQRMKKRDHMRWGREGANTLLQIRWAVLNGQDVKHFKRWYPPDRRLVSPPKIRAA